MKFLRNIADAIARRRGLQLVCMIVAFQAYVVMIFWLPLRDWVAHRSGSASPVPAGQAGPQDFPRTAGPSTRIVEIDFKSDFFTSQITSGVAFASSQASNLPPSNAKDLDEKTFWCSGDTGDDTMLCMTNAEPFLPIAITLVLYRPPEGLRIADLSVVASDGNVRSNATFEMINARATPADSFTRTVSLPGTLNDGVFVALQLDSSDPGWKPHKAWGVTCLSLSRGQRRVHAAGGEKSICIREMMVHTSSFNFAKEP